ncbi:hypothetical protein RIR_jg7305.t1 [Rhizophagus irregularis DAOM 181602=DAOM 197198]|nr:hypothetical protein RIR_jg7305.t1 [Rhizophagus irregularis DAOM 181602=DAOM 197198]
MELTDGYTILSILSPKIHKYFKQKLSEWNITGGRMKTQQLIDSYRQGPDTDVAKNWEKEYPTRPLIYINQLIYNGRSNNMGLLRIHLKGLHSTFDSQKFGCCFLIRILLIYYNNIYNKNEKLLNNDIYKGVNYSIH